MSVSNDGKSMAASLSELREKDHDRFLTLFFAPSAARPALTALYAFNLEIARIPELVTEPMMGHIRLQWWREVLEGLPQGETRGHAAAVALHEAGNVPLDRLQTLIDARERDLSDEPFPDMAALEAYADETSSALMRVAALILGGAEKEVTSEKALYHAGIAYALTGILRALPVHASQGRMLLPGDIILERNIDPHDVFAGKLTDGMTLAIGEIAARALEHLASAREAQFDKAILPALLPATFCERYLDLMTAPGFDPFKVPVEVPAFQRQLRLMGRSLAHRF